MNGVDMAGLALLGVSVLLGLFRGLIAQILSLAGWVAAYFASQWIAPRLAGFIPFDGWGASAKMVTAMALGFIAVLLVWGIMAMVIVSAVRATGMSGPDRLLGAAFGLFRGLVIAAAVVTVVQMTALAQAAPWRASVGVSWVRVMLRGLSPLLPPEVVHEAGWGESP